MNRLQRNEQTRQANKARLAALAKQPKRFFLSTQRMMPKGCVMAETAKCKRCKGAGAIPASPDDFPAEWLSCPDCEGT